MSDLARAIELAVAAHKGQVDKAGKPYILHPLRVMFAGEDVDQMIVGVLHDVVEDTPATLDVLRASGFSEHVVESVDAVTRREDETYTQFINRIAKSTRTAIKVKLHDFEDNMSPARLSKLPVTDVSWMMKRYIPAHEQLTHVLRDRWITLSNRGQNYGVS